MIDLAPERCAALRCLYVDYDVPVELLALFSRFSQATLNEVIRQKNWANTVSSQRRRTKLNRAFDELVSDIEKHEKSSAELEKAARVLIASTKALEGIETLEEKTDYNPPENGSLTHEKREPLNADIAELFSRDLEILVATLEAQEITRPDSPSVGKDAGELQA